MDILEPSLDTFAECADLAIPSRALADSTKPILSVRFGRATYLSAEQLQANKNLNAKAVATVVEYLIKHQ